MSTQTTGALRPEASFAPDLLRDQVCIVTGGATGIGLALCRAMARLGARLAIASRNQAKLDAATAELGALGAEVLAVPTNVREPEQVDRMVKAVVDRFGRIDVLVNNHGANFVCPAAQMTPNGWRTVVDVVLNGTFYCSSAAGKVMFEQKRGSIINMAATNGTGGSPLMCHSGAAKAGVINLTQSLAVEWAPFGVRVNAVAPGPVSTEGANSRLWSAPDVMASMERKVPLGRFASAEDCVGAVLYLCSDAARFLTGAVIAIDGGESLRKIPDLAGLG
jgi:NAD(P)-dependent dehydrogenase (short-subunit alcohol dehydrogenase family)